MHCCLQCHFLDHGIEIQFLFRHSGLDNIVHLPHDYCHASSTSHQRACQNSKHTQRMDHLQWLCTKNNNKQKSGQNIEMINLSVALIKGMHATTLNMQHDILSIGIKLGIVGQRTAKQL